MESLGSSMHPLLFFAIEICTTAFVVGFTSPHSFARPFALPFVALCAYAIITTSSHFMRLRWASLLSGCAVGFVLQYVELALLSRWSYETKASAILQRTQATIKERDDEHERLQFGFFTTLSFRSVGTEFEVKNTPAFRNDKPPSRFAFILEQTLLVVVCIAVIDFSSVQPPPPNVSELFAQNKVPLFSRLGDVTQDELILRMTSTLVYWANMWAIMQGVTSFIAAIAVVLGMSEVKAWRPLFGSPLKACHLRGFWGNFWHQTLRRILSHPPSFVAHRLLGLTKASGLARYFKLLFTFALSGLLHTLAELGGGLSLQQSGTMRFFVMQALGIMFEDAIKTVVGRGEKIRIHAGLATRLFGYTWTIFFLVWTTPTWLYPDAAEPPKTPFLPFSLVKIWDGNM